MRDGPRDRGGPDASGPPPFRGPAYKTKLCALWRGRGGCPRPNCGFAHGEAELRRPPPRPSFQPRPRPGRRDSRDLDFRFRPERRHSPRGRYSPERDTRGRSFRDDKASSQDRGSSQSRSPIRKRERKHRKSPDGGKSDSSESFRTSDNEDKEKDERYPSSDEKNTDYEVQLKQVHVDMEALREDKSKLEVILEKKTEEVRKLSNKVDDLESQLNEAKEDYQRSQARFERLADLLASDTLKPYNKDQGSIGNANEDQYNTFEMSPSDQRQNHVSTARKRSIALSTSEEAKTGKKKRESDDGMIPIPVPEKYRPEHALEPSNNSNGNGMPKSFSAQKKLGEGDYGEGGNIVSSSNIFTDRVRTKISLYALPYDYCNLCKFCMVEKMRMFMLISELVVVGNWTKI
ncbi:hypothetical protein PR202_gb28240 [Eleusine coracana subsp. coracana]|uniref:C3H1-type domain-containing protein n=1 Tax=Eleusine coracana subsp. coracana TaxID=191504 RepID=A0AAV5FWG5_ELECO|nr:hypothetical protein PR202_gb28240 [Eleusine coracana subsp. coracana]